MLLSERFRINKLLRANQREATLIFIVLCQRKWKYSMKCRRVPPSLKAILFSKPLSFTEISITCSIPADYMLLFHRLPCSIYAKLYYACQVILLNHFL